MKSNNLATRGSIRSRPQKPKFQNQLPAAPNWGCGPVFVTYDFRSPPRRRQVSGGAPGRLGVGEFAVGKVAKKPHFPGVQFTPQRSRGLGKPARSAEDCRLVKQIRIFPACDLKDFSNALTIIELRRLQLP